MLSLREPRMNDKFIANYLAYISKMSAISCDIQIAQRQITKIKDEFSSDIEYRNYRIAFFEKRIADLVIKGLSYEIPKL